MGLIDMDGRFWDGSAPRHEGGNVQVKKEEPDREKMIAARARQRAIGRELRRMYDDVVQEPVPDDFLDLLQSRRVFCIRIDADPELGKVRADHFVCNFGPANV